MRAQPPMHRRLYTTAARHLTGGNLTGDLIGQLTEYLLLLLLLLPLLMVV